MTEDYALNEAAYLELLCKNDPTVPLVDHFSLLLEESEAVWEPTGIDASQYLDQAEDILRQFAVCQNQDGGIIDPYAGAEKEFVTASYVKTGAILLQAGRCDDLRESILLAMDLACRQLGTNTVPDAHGDFVTHMLMLAYRILSPDTQGNRVEAWKNHLSGFDPELVYSQVERRMPLKNIRNWATYSMHGEMMRYKEGVSADKRFIDKYLPPQMTRFTPEGLYRDPNVAATYDLAARDQLSGLLKEGYTSEFTPLLELLLHRGMRTMLFMQSSTGESSCGGRSNQFIWNELTFAHLCEREATRLWANNETKWAGVFKRAARRAFSATLRWRADSLMPRLNKSRFHPEKRHGMEFYAYYANYSLYAAQIAASCYLSANDLIPEVPTPSDIGGYVMNLPAFNRTYATTGSTGGNYHVMLDHYAQRGHDATGFVRLHRAHMPGELALSVGIPGKERNESLVYVRPHLAMPSPEWPVSIGVTWRDGFGVWHSLAQSGRSKQEVFSELGPDGNPLKPEISPWDFRVEAKDTQSGTVEFQVIYTAKDPAALDIEPADDFERSVVKDRNHTMGVGGCQEIRETYHMHAGGVEVEWELIPASDGILTAIAAVIPFLESNGVDGSEISGDAGELRLNYMGYTYIIKPEAAVKENEAKPVLELFPSLMPNRNGLYGLAQWTYKDRLRIRFSLQLVK
ncbi:hypothetical protein QFZ77_003290 [Paenibacillus sp. V4I3]|uniref:hypothetical protein n=1 Tax=Paenibacillus sp. V4I3 TaxID=3042305 RepID=UPI0027898D8B|nr:hypothetical protein [Paenibacillus sp. V4I3]MDQ0874631.1 hypothetical protein [Paenibacillus sp. V4I3]